MGPLTAIAGGLSPVLPRLEPKLDVFLKERPSRLRSSSRPRGLVLRGPAFVPASPTKETGRVDSGKGNVATTAAAASVAATEGTRPLDRCCRARLPHQSPPLLLSSCSLRARLRCTRPLLAARQSWRGRFGATTARPAPDALPLRSRRRDPFPACRSTRGFFSVGGRRFIPENPPFSPSLWGGAGATGRRARERNCPLLPGTEENLTRSVTRGEPVRL